MSTRGVLATNWSATANCPDKNHHRLTRAASRSATRQTKVSLA